MATRFNKFRAHMVGNGFMWRDISDVLGIAPNSCLLASQRETIRAEYHAKLLALGFPLDVLPFPSKKRPRAVRVSQIAQLTT